MAYSHIDHDLNQWCIISQQHRDAGVWINGNMYACWTAGGSAVNTKRDHPIYLRQEVSKIMTEAAPTPATEGGFKIGNEYVVVDNSFVPGVGCNNSINVGDVVTFVRDDKSDMPWFQTNTGKSIPIKLFRLRQRCSDPTFTREQIIRGLDLCGYSSESCEIIMQSIRAVADPEYEIYLRLKQKFDTGAIEIRPIRRA